MKHGLLLGISLCLGSPAFAVSAFQQVQAPAATAAEVAGNRFLDAFNGEASLEPFIASSFTAVSLEREPAAQRARPFDELRAASGGFVLLSAKKEGDRMIELVVESRRGGKHGKIVLFTSGKEPGKIADIFVLPARDPARLAADVYPERKLPQAQVASEIRRRLDSLTAEDSFSGVVLVARGDKIIVREARGQADKAWKIPVTPETRFNIASIGKVFTATAVLRLVEQGKLSLDDTLADRVPAYPHRDSAAKITLRHLLTHSAGLGAWDGREHGGISPTEAAATMTEPPQSDPGARFSYSNAGFVLLGAAIEQATGLPYEQAVRELVFDPAKMRSTGLWPVTAIIPNRATGYLRPPSDPLGFGPRFSNEQFLGHGGDPSGGAYSNADDLFAFYRTLLGGRLLKPETLKTMTADPVEFSGAPRPWRYGLGVRMATCGGKPVLGHGGGGANSGTSNESYVSADGEWTVIVLSNYDPPAADDFAAATCDFVQRQ
jgi:D-alanyl-D-alanine carboxypeptidase